MLKYFWVILFLSFIVLACDNSNDAIQLQTAKRDLPDHESWGNKFEITIEGRPRAIILSGYFAKYRKKQFTIFADSIHIDFFDEFGRHQSELIADSGKVFEKNDNIIAWGNVEVISDSGVVLATEVLNWDNKKRKIYTDSFCTFYTKTDTLYGDYFESDPDLSNYTIANPRGVSHRTSDEK